jgi:hypothetical protein
MDYLQIDFDGNLFTLYRWPVIIVDNIEFKFENASYRNKLCSLIAKVVQRVNIVEDKMLIIIEFDNDIKILISTDSSNPEIAAPEVAVFTDSSNKSYVF